MWDPAGRAREVDTEERAQLSASNGHGENEQQFPMALRDRPGGLASTVRPESEFSPIRGFPQPKQLPGYIG